MDYSTQFISGLAAVAKFESNVTPLNYAQLEPGYRVIVNQDHHLTEVPNAEVSKYLAKQSGAEEFAKIDIGIVKDWRQSKNVLSVEKVHEVRSAAGVLKQFMTQNVFALTQEYCVLRNPEDTREGGRMRSLYGYTYPMYKGGLVLNGDAMPVRPDVQKFGLFPIYGIRVGIDPTAFQIGGTQVIADPAKYAAAKANPASTKAEIQKEWDEYEKASNTYWKHAFLRALVAGQVLRLSIGQYTIEYVRSIIASAEEFAGKPEEARHAMYEQFKANEIRQKEYQTYKETGVSNRIAPRAGVVYPKWGTKDEYWTLEELRALPVFSRVNIMYSRDGMGSCYPGCWTNDQESQDRLLSRCVAGYAIRVQAPLK